MKWSQTMKSYENWIMEHYSTPMEARLQCKEASEEMSKQFPDLKLVRGQIEVEEPYDLPPTKTEHWWCVMPDGKVIDPTAHQYQTRILSYTPTDKSRGEPTGKCMNCGDIAYNNSQFCKKECEQDFIKSLG